MSPSCQVRSPHWWQIPSSPSCSKSSPVSNYSRKAAPLSGKVHQKPWEGPDLLSLGHRPISDPISVTKRQDVPHGHSWSQGRGRLHGRESDPQRGIRAIPRRRGNGCWTGARTCPPRPSSNHPHCTESPSLKYRTVILFKPLHLCNLEQVT